MGKTVQTDHLAAPNYSSSSLITAMEIIKIFTIENEILPKSLFCSLPLSVQSKHLV